VTAPEALEGGGIYIDMARKFGDEAMRKPLVGPRKVMIIQGADRMQMEAQNALLKTFEEPVPGLSILLIATNANELLPTVRSRAWHLPLSLAPDSAIGDWLRGIFPALEPAALEAAVTLAAGCPGAAWREASRSAENNEEHEARFATVSQIVERIVRSQPVGALGLTEEAIRLSKVWWQEDFGEKELKKGDAKVARSAAARFLDELTKVYRARWQEAVNLTSGGADVAAWMDGLDQIRKTRHYILSNASTTLALDVLFGRLIALQR
jgi:DNA polymerase-3 subunit delta'